MSAIKLLFQTFLFLTFNVLNKLDLQILIIHFISQLNSSYEMISNQ